MMIPLPELHRLGNLVYPLLVIAASGEPAGESALAKACDINRKTARRRLASLAELGYLQRAKSHNGYTLTTRAQTIFDPPPNGEKNPELGNESARSGELCLKIGQEVPKNGQPLPKPGPTTTESSTDINRACLGEEEAPQNGEIIPKIGEPIPISDETLSALRACGIGEPKRSELARLPWVTPEAIGAWKDHLRRRGRLAPGLLIHCLASGDTAPGEAPVTPVLDELLAGFEEAG